MTHKEILERMDGANPLPDVEMITDGQLAEMTLRVEESRRADSGQPQPLTPIRPKVRWRRPAIAFAGAVLAASVVIGGVSLVTGGDSDVADEQPSTTSTTLNPLPDGWNPVLATTFAGVPPQPAACPPGTDPSLPGPEGQNVPISRGDDHDGAFDQHLGKMIYVDVGHQTWTFDVCTNTWEQADAAGEAIDTSLVYDADSDVTIALGPGYFSVYDAATNEWTQPDLDVIGGAHPDGFSGVAYDPVSGMVLTTSEDVIWALDVDTASLTRVGAAPTGAQFAGYVAGLDRLVFVGLDTILVDPRNGELSTAGPAPAYSAYGYGFFEAADTVFMSRFVGAVVGVCGFDTETLAWNRCYDAAPLAIGAFSSKVDDSINNRVILTQSKPTAHDIWTLDLTTGSTSEVVSSDGIPTLNVGWEPVLASTKARPAPAPAACTEGTAPDGPGPIDQQRPTTPDADDADDHDGAFDRRTGRIIYVDTMQRTWAFDVCTNTWHNLEPEGTPLDESLVYDVDSDVTIALGPGYFSVYDAAANEWTIPPLEVIGEPAPTYFEGVAYDPVSGLVVTTADGQVWALDVEAHTLTMISSTPLGSQLAGYVESIDRLVFVADLATVLVDPRTGEITMPATGEVPFAGWGWYDFFDAAGTVFIGANVGGAGEGCGFNPDSLAWDLCLQRMSPSMDLFASRVEDPINGRVVLIHYSRIQGRIIDAVWALDLQGQMIELLAPSE